jgi:hypothetical protein
VWLLHLAAEIEAGVKALGLEVRPVRGARTMTGLADFDVGETVYEAAVYYDDGDNPVAEEGPSAYTTSERQAEAFARQALSGRRPEHKGGFWYAAIRRGQVVDPIGDGRPYDHSFESDRDWSRTLLADE